MQQVRTIRDALIRADPGCTEGYRERADVYLARLAALDRRLEQALAPHRGRTLVTQHAVAPYLARRYGLKTVHLVLEPDTPPSPADLRRVDSVVRAEGLQGLLVDPGEPPGALRALARDRGLKLVPLDPLEVAGVPVVESPEHFIRVMERNGEALLEVLAVRSGSSG
jgi:ABC-type Zn uptake system ZnuABC Zn-binding protein ZnuA